MDEQVINDEKLRKDQSERQDLRGRLREVQRERSEVRIELDGDRKNKELFVKLNRLDNEYNYLLRTLQ